MLAHPGRDLPPTIEDAVLARAAALPATAWEVLDVVGLSPDGLPLPVLSKMGAGAEADDRMQSPGLAAIEIAKANGWWSILDDVEALIEPDDLAAALDAVPEARAHWDGFPPSARKQMLWWVKSAVKDQTRTRRITAIVDQASTGQRATG